MIVSLLAAAMLAQTSGPVLSLDEALATAERENLDLKTARSRLTQARELSAKAWSGYLPQVSAGGTYTWNSTSASLAMPSGYVIRDVGEPTSAPFDPSRPPGLDNPTGQPTNLVMTPSGLVEAEIQREHQLGVQVQAQQALIAPALWGAIRNAQLGIEVAELNVENARREVLLAVAQLYYGAASAREMLEVQRRLLEVNEAHEKDARLRLEQGTVTKVALLRARIERTRAEQDVRRAEIAYASAKSSLAVLLAREPDFEVQRPETPAVPEAPGGDLTGHALRVRPDVEAARRGLEIARVDRRSTLLSYLPTLAAFGQFNLSNTAGFTGRHDIWMAGLSLNWTLFDGGLREANVRESNARLEESHLALASAELRVRDEVRRALMDLEGARANVLKAEEQLTLARENAELVRVAYEAGMSTYLEVVDANAALTNAELARVAEELNADISVLKLARAAGVFGAR